MICRYITAKEKPYTGAQNNTQGMSPNSDYLCNYFNRCCCWININPKMEQHDEKKCSDLFLKFTQRHDKDCKT